MSLTKEQILEALKRNHTPRKVTMPELGGDVYLRRMTLPEQIDWEDEQLQLLTTMPGEDLKQKQKRGVEMMKGRLIRSLCDETGNLLFGQEDKDALDLLSSGEVIRLHDEFLRASGITEQDIEELKKSSTTQPEDSSTGGVTEDTSTTPKNTPSN